MAAAARRALLAAQNAQNADFVKQQFRYTSMKSFDAKMVNNASETLEFVIRLRHWRESMPDHTEKMLMEEFRLKKMTTSMQRAFDRQNAVLNIPYPGTFNSFIDYVFKKYAPPLSIEYMEANIKALRVRVGEDPGNVYEAYEDAMDLYEKCRVLINGRMQHANDHIPVFPVQQKFKQLRKLFIDNNNHKHLINQRMRKIFVRGHPSNYAAIIAIIDDGLKQKIQPICDANNKDLQFVTYKSESKIMLFARNTRGNTRGGRDTTRTGNAQPYDGYVCDICNTAGHWKRHCPTKFANGSPKAPRGRGGRNNRGGNRGGNGGRGRDSRRGGHRGGNGGRGQTEGRGRKRDRFDFDACYRCGKKNHFARDCGSTIDVNGNKLAPAAGPPSKRQKTGNNSDKNCHRCGRNNHFIRECKAYFHILGQRLPPLAGREGGRGGYRGGGSRGRGRGRGWRGRGGQGGSNNSHNTNHHLHISHEFGVPPQPHAAQRPQPATAVQQFAHSGQFAQRQGH